MDWISKLQVSNLQIEKPKEQKGKRFSYELLKITREKGKKHFTPQAM